MWDIANNLFKRWTGAAWTNLVLALTGGGTGASTAADARTNLSVDSSAEVTAKIVSALADLIPTIRASFSRAKFAYNGGATAYTIKVGPAKYWCKDKYCFWTSELITNAIGSPVANTHYYLYLDYSEITSNVEITAAKLILSATAPGSDGYNGDDKCIFSVRTNATPNNILEFFHDGGDLVFFADALSVLSNTDIDTTWTDVNMLIPAFCRKALATFIASFVAACTYGGTWSWRTNGQTGTAGHTVAISYALGADSSQQWNSIPVITDASGIIEVKKNYSDNHSIAINQDGWYFPPEI